MTTCAHLYEREDQACLQAQTGDSPVCIWHNSAVSKRDAYVPALLIQADRLANGNLSEFHLAGLVWPHAALPLRNLRMADLRDAFLDGADMAGCDLSGATLRRASLKNADLHGACLAGCDLTGVNFSQADLRDADLTNAILADTVLISCDLRGAKMGGAQVENFLWNRLTRFAGVTGLEANELVDDSAATQRYLTPLAHDDAHAEVSALAEHDPAALKTRNFAPKPNIADARPGSASMSTALTGRFRTKRQSRGWKAQWPIAAAAAVALAIGGVGGELIPWRSDSATLHQSPVGHNDHELQAMLQQHEADLVQLRQLQANTHTVDQTISSAKQEIGVSHAAAEQLRARLLETSIELMRLRGADDTAAILTMKLEKLQKANDRLTRTCARQDELSRILADGVDRLQGDNKRLANERDQHLTDEAQVRSATSQVAQDQKTIASLTSERTDLQGQNRKLLSDLLGAQHDIERYLARVNATHLQDYLTQDDHQLPIMHVEAGKPIVLSGDYMVTLRVEAGTPPGTITCALVAQRPSAAANPELTVVLYDADEHPLRRIAFSFPHIDEGKPFVSASTTVACDRFPTFARVQISPGLDELAAKK